MTQAEVLQHLDRNTHSLFTSEFVNITNKAFNTKLEPMTYKASPNDPKGLTLDSGAKSAVGIAAFDLAIMLCRALNVEYEAKMGRSFQVRACTEALLAAGYGKED